MMSYSLVGDPVQQGRKLTYPSIRPDLKSRENSKCRLTFGSRAAGFAGALGAIVDDVKQRYENELIRGSESRRMSHPASYIRS